MVVRLKQPHGQVNPHGFDFELWMWGQGLGATGYVRAGRHDPPPARLETTWQYPVAQSRQWMRDRVQSRIADPQWSGLINALLMGDQASIERADWDVFRATGVAHLVSISGLHVTMFAWLCGGLVRWAWRRTDRWGTSWCLWLPADQAARWAGLGLAVLYALFSGWGIPAQRTIWMLTWVTVLSATGRRWPWPQVWLSACAWVLLADPTALGQAGFWLSFVAVGVLFATGQGPPTASADVSWPQRLWRLWREQLAITLCLAPLSLWLFQQVQAQGGSVLLTGDIEAAQEKALIASTPLGADGASPLRADVLLVPHHGSNTSSTAEFLAAVAPRWAWVQAGYRNRYGHPTAAVMARYQAQGTTVLESVRCGAGRWRSAQADQVHCERSAHARYWHHQVP
jgi:ComEC/Rec2-related protein